MFQDCCVTAWSGWSDLAIKQQEAMDTIWAKKLIQENTTQILFILKGIRQCFFRFFLSCSVLQIIVPVKCLDS